MLQLGSPGGRFDASQSTFSQLKVLLLNGQPGIYASNQPLSIVVLVVKVTQ